MIHLYKGFSDIDHEPYYFVSAAEKVPDAEVVTTFTPEQAIMVGNMLSKQGDLALKKSKKAKKTKK